MLTSCYQKSKIYLIVLSKQIYLGRIKECLSFAYLVQDKLENLRSTCHEILELEDPESCFDLLRASALVYLAESFTFECYDSASKYIKESLKQLEPYYFEREKQRRQEILNTYAFIKLINKKIWIKSKYIILLRNLS